MDHNIYCAEACLRDDHSQFVKVYVKRNDGIPNVDELRRNLLSVNDN
jgi:hypothetical protein